MPHTVNNTNELLSFKITGIQKTYKEQPAYLIFLHDQKHAVHAEIWTLLHHTVSHKRESYP